MDSKLLMLNLKIKMKGSFKIQPHSSGPKAKNQSGTTKERKRRPKKMKWIKEKQNRRSNVSYFLLVVQITHSKHNHTPPIKKIK